MEKNKFDYKYNVYSLGAAGDTTDNMIFGNSEYLEAIDDVVDITNEEPAAFIFSGGGNDILGTVKFNNEEVPVFKEILINNPTNPTIETVFNIEKTNAQFDFLRKAYKELFSSIHDEYPDLPILVHSYDYVIPGDKDDPRDPFYAAKDKWIGQPMADIGINDKGLQTGIVHTLLDRFQLLQKEIIEEHNESREKIDAENSPEKSKGRVHLVETLGTLTHISEWNDEIHPNDDGYMKIAQKFFAKLDEVLANGS